MKVKTFEDNVILSVFNYDFSQSKNRDKFNIAYGIDENFLFGCGVSIASVLISNPEVDFSFNIFTDSLGDNEKKKLSDLAKQYKSEINIYLIDCDQLKCLPSTNNWTYATYFRFIIADYFAGKVDKVLYLDADIACKGSIQELVDLQFSSQEVAAVVVERDIEWWEQRAETLKTDALKNGYFNAGFLLINIPLWNKENISGQAMNMLKDPVISKRITHLDQDVLNILLTGTVQFINKKFNTQFSINYELKKDITYPVDDDTVFIHYIGPTKPWHNWGGYEISKVFLQAKERSPWNMTPLLEPGNSHQIRYAAKHMLNKKNYLIGISLYIKYFLSKLK